jgi:hypothetical protein
MSSLPPSAPTDHVTLPAPITIRGALGWTLVVTPSGSYGIGSAILESNLTDLYSDPDDTPEERARGAGLIEGVERMVLALASTPHFHPDAIRMAVDTVLENTANEA